MDENRVNLDRKAIGRWTSNHSHGVFLRHDYHSFSERESSLVLCYRYLLNFLPKLFERLFKETCLSSYKILTNSLPKEKIDKGVNNNTFVVLKMTRESLQDLVSVCQSLYLIRCQLRFCKQNKINWSIWSYPIHFRCLIIDPRLSIVFVGNSSGRAHRALCLHRHDFSIPRVHVSGALATLYLYVDTEGHWKNRVHRSPGQGVWD